MKNRQQISKLIRYHLNLFSVSHFYTQLENLLRIPDAEFVKPILNNLVFTINLCIFQLNVSETDRNYFWNRCLNVASQGSYKKQEQLFF